MSEETEAEATAATVTPREWLAGLRESGAARAQLGTHPRDASSDWARALAESEPLTAVTELDASKARWGDDAIAQLGRVFPAMQRLTLGLDPKHCERVGLALPRLRELDLSLKRRTPKKPIELACASRVLEALRVHDPGPSIDRAALVRVVTNAPETMRSVTIVGPEAWEIAHKVAITLRRIAPGSRAEFAASHRSIADTSGGSDLARYESAADPRRASDWAALLGVFEAGFSVAPMPAFALAHTPERFAVVREQLGPRTTELYLDNDCHGFVMRDPALLAGLDRLERLTLFDAYELSSEGLLRLCEALPALRHLRISNSHNPAFATLAVRSASLRTLALTHCHALRGYALDAPALERLELDNTDGETVEKHPDSKDPKTGDGCRCYGNLGERLARDLLDGAEGARLPALRELVVWHNHNTYGGPPPVYEELRVDVKCATGHAKLEELTFARCVHLRSLRLANVPALRVVRVADHPRQEDDADNESWFERFEPVDLDPACVIEVEPAGRKRAAPSLKNGGAA